MSTPRKIGLQTWLDQTYGRDAPTRKTAQRWCKTGKIYPSPEKHGRDWMLVPDAIYVDKDHNDSLIERLRRGNAQK